VGPGHLTKPEALMRAWIGPTLGEVIRVGVFFMAGAVLVMCLMYM